MSYLVLARKYRPRDFAALVGQEHVVQALANALSNQRLHHAYLFTGTRGVGKTTVSRILAKSLNCVGADGRGGITATPCGVCEACTAIDAGRHVDYVELDAASNRGVEEISQLLDQAVYKPVMGRFKVYMIDEVHMLSNHAFNAMLKTLEEPPEYLKFVLATTDPQKVPPTVLSRCLQFNLRPMAPATVETHLADVLLRESIAAEPGALRLLARAARGSMRDALSLTDQAIAYGGGALEEEGVRRMLGAVDRGHAVRLVEALAAGDGAALIAAVDGLRGLGLSAAGTLEEMAALLQQMAVQQAVPGALDEHDPDAAAALRLAGALAPDETQLLYGLALHGRAELALAPDEYSGLVMVLLRFLAFKPAGGAPLQPVSPAAPAPAPKTAPLAAARPPVASSPVPRPTPAAAGAAARPASVTPDAVDPLPACRDAVSAAAPRTAAAPLVVTPDAGVARPAPVSAPPAARARAAEPEPPPWLDAPDVDAADTSEPAPAAAPRPGATPQPRALAPAPVPQVATTPLGDRWMALVQQMQAEGSIGALVRELAIQAECVALDERADPVALSLRVEREVLRSAGNVEKLRAALAQALGVPVALTVESGVAEDSPARRDAAERARRQAEAEQIIHDDPLVRALLAQYRTARIVPGSVKPH